MKQGKNPTRKQKLAIMVARLNSDNWLVTKALSGELHLEHRHTGRARVLKKGRIE